MKDRLLPNRTSVAAMMARRATPAEAVLIQSELLGLNILKRSPRPPLSPWGEG